MAMAPITKTGREGLDELQKYTLMPRLETGLRPASGWLNDVDLVVMANVDILATAEAAKVADDLADFVRRGGGLLIFLGSQTDTKSALDAYNALFFGNGTGPMPARLLEPVGLANERREGEHLLADDLSHPVLADFKAKAEPLRSARFFRHVKAELPPASGATVLLRYSGGDPAVVLGRFGEGLTALVTTSADGDWNTFYGKPDFPPLMQMLAYYLSPPADRSRNLAIGGTLAEPLTARQASARAELTGPPGLVRRAGQVPEPAVVAGLTPAPRREGHASSWPADRRTLLVSHDKLDRPGLYRLRVAGSSGVGAVEAALLEEEPAEYLYAVNPPARSEGDLASLDADLVAKTILGEGATMLRSDQVGQSRKELIGGTEVSRTLLYLVLALCLLETFLAQQFGHFRE